MSDAGHRFRLGKQSSEGHRISGDCRTASRSKIRQDERDRTAGNFDEPFPGWRDAEADVENDVGEATGATVIRTAVAAAGYVSFESEPCRVMDADAGRRGRRIQSLLRDAFARILGRDRRRDKPVRRHFQFRPRDEILLRGYGLRSRRKGKRLFARNGVHRPDVDSDDFFVSRTSP